MIEYNFCDKCRYMENTLHLNWIDAETFKPLKNDKFNNKKHKKAIKNGYSALCNDCYKIECCD